MEGQKCPARDKQQSGCACSVCAPTHKHIWSDLGRYPNICIDRTCCPSVSSKIHLELDRELGWAWHLLWGRSQLVAVLLGQPRILQTLRAGAKPE